MEYPVPGRALLIVAVIVVASVGAGAGAGVSVASAQSDGGETGGEVVWRAGGDEFVNDLVLGPERVYAVYDKRVAAYDRTTGDVMWDTRVIGRNSARSLFLPRVDVGEGQLVVAGGSESPTVAILDAVTGAVVHSQGVASPRAVVATDAGALVASRRDGGTAMLAFDRTGAVRWRTTVEAGVRSLLATDDTVVVGGFAETVGLDPEDGSTVWTADAGLSGATRYDGEVVGYESAGFRRPARIAAIDPATGAVRTVGAATDEIGFTSDIVAGEGRLAARVPNYGQPRPPRLHVYDLRDGRLLVNRSIEEPFGHLAVGGDTVYVEDDENSSLRAFNASTGALRWTATAGTPFGMTALVADADGVFVGTVDGLVRYRTAAGSSGGGAGENGGDVTLPAPIAGATDPDGDGVYEDLTGDGVFSILDVATFLTVFDDPALQGAAVVDINGDGRVSILDVAQLLSEL